MTSNTKSKPAERTVCRLVTDVPPSMRDRLKAVARRNDRSMGVELKRALRAHLEREAERAEAVDA